LDEPRANLAAAAIIARLGSLDTTSAGGDSFLIPIRYHNLTPNIPDDIIFAGDFNSNITIDSIEVGAVLTSDIVAGLPFATFEPAPTPPTIALAVLTLALMGAMRRRRREG